MERTISTGPSIAETFDSLREDVKVIMVSAQRDADQLAAEVKRRKAAEKLVRDTVTWMQVMAGGHVFASRWLKWFNEWQATVPAEEKEPT